MHHFFVWFFLHEEYLGVAVRVEWLVARALLEKVLNCIFVCRKDVEILVAEDKLIYLCFLVPKLTGRYFDFIKCGVLIEFKGLAPSVVVNFLVVKLKELFVLKRVGVK